MAAGLTIIGREDLHGDDIMFTRSDGKVFQLTFQNGRASLRCTDDPPPKNRIDLDVITADTIPGAKRLVLAYPAGWP